MINTPTKIRQQDLVNGFTRYMRNQSKPDNVDKQMFREIARQCENKSTLELNTTVRLLALATCYSIQQTMTSLLKLRKAGVFSKCLFTPESDLVIIHIKLFDHAD